MVAASNSNDDKTLVTGASEAEKSEPVRFEPNEYVGPNKDKRQPDGELPDAEDATDLKDEESGKDEAPPGAVAPDDLSTESDDGAS